MLRIFEQSPQDFRADSGESAIKSPFSSWIVAKFFDFYAKFCLTWTVTVAKIRASKYRC